MRENLHWQLLKDFPDRWTHHNLIPGEGDAGHAIAMAELEDSGYVTYREKFDGEWRRTPAGRYVVQLRNQRDTLISHIKAAILYFDDPENSAVNAGEMTDAERMAGVYSQLIAALAQVQS
jgi:hypothetical protein